MIALRRSRLLPACFAAISLWACGGEDLTLPPAPTSEVRMVDGNQQVSLPGSRLPNPLIVRLVDQSGEPIPDRTVLWVVKLGGGAISPTTGMTDAEGFASAEWTLGPDAGPNTADAQVPDIGAVTFTATATAGGGGAPAQATQIEPVEGDDQSAAVGTAVPTRPAVRALDDQGHPVAGVPVTFVVTGGGGSVSGADQTTDADGLARLEGWTLGDAPGTNTLEARSGSLQGSPVVFTAEGTGGGTSVDHLTFLVEPPAEVARNQKFTIQVGLVDANGNVVPLSGIFIYVGLFEEGEDHPTNDDLDGERFENTDNGVAVLDLDVQKKGRFRLRALTDDLPELGPHGPEPYLFSRVFEVK